MGTIYPGLGPSEVAPLVNKNFDLRRARLSPEEYFVLTRVDGRTSLRELVLISGFAEGQTLNILRHLRQAGAVYLPGEDPARPPPPDPDLEDNGPVPSAIDDATLDAGVLAEAVDLTDAQKRLILKKHASLAGGTYFSVLEVPRSSDKKAVRDAFRRVSKDFHPDKYFGKRLGSYAKLLADIFEIAKEAFDVLSDDTRREEYLIGLGGARSGNTPPLGTPAAASGVHSPVAQVHEKQRAAEIYVEACNHQATGELDRSLSEFAAAISIDPQPKYLKRAAEAFLKAQRLRDAEEYAKKATELSPQDAAAHRVHGKVLLAKGQKKEARRALATAARLDPGNPYIAADLRALGPTSDDPGDEG